MIFVQPTLFLCLLLGNNYRLADICKESTEVRRAFPPGSSGDCTLLNDRTRAKMTDSETASVSSASFHRVSKSMEPRPPSRCRILYHHKCCPHTIQNHTCSPPFSSPNIPSLWSLVFFFMIWSLQECHIMEWYSRWHFEIAFLSPPLIIMPWHPSIVQLIYGSFLFIGEWYPAAWACHSWFTYASILGCFLEFLVWDLLQIKVLWRAVHRLLCGHSFSFPWDRCPGVAYRLYG